MIVKRWSSDVCLLGLLWLMVVQSAIADEGLTVDAMVGLLQQIDDRQRQVGDYQAIAYLEQKERGKDDIAYEVRILRRDEDDKLIILFLRPKSEAGKGYLRIDKNLFLYDPTVGKWERRTERERIGGTNSQRSDFDESRLAQEFDPSFVGVEKLGKFQVWHLILQQKPGVDVAYPTLHLWVDMASKNVLKQQQFALSGRLMRTSYTPTWKQIYSESKQGMIYFPEEMRIFDEVDKQNSTTILFRQIDLHPLESNLFTKAWFERQSR